MQRNGMRYLVSSLAASAVLIAGCQFPGIRSAQKERSDYHDRPLDDHQLAEVQLSLARSLELRGEFGPAINAYRLAIDKDPRNAASYWHLATLHDRQGKLDESETLYRQALKLDSKNADLLGDYGYSLYLQRRWAESEERLRKAIALNPKDSRFHNNLGLVLAQIERTDEAIAEFCRAKCNAADAHCNVAFVMTLNGRWSQARQQYELALTADPESAVASSGLANLESIASKASAKAGTIALTSHETSSKAARVNLVSTTTARGDSVGRATISTTDGDE